MRPEAASHYFRAIISATDPIRTLEESDTVIRNFAAVGLVSFLLCSYANADGADSLSAEDFLREQELNAAKSRAGAEAGVRADMTTKIEVVVSLVKYDDQYYRFHHTDGSVDFHKISAFRIVDPIEYSGRYLNIRHAVSPEPDSIWRNEGAVLRLRLLKSDLEFVADAIGSLGVQLVEVVEPD